MMVPTPGTIMVQEQWEETIGPGTIPEIEMIFSLRWRFQLDPLPEPGDVRRNVLGRDAVQGVPDGGAVQGVPDGGAVQGAHTEAVVPRPRRSIKPNPKYSPDVSDLDYVKVSVYS
jgi:hypothetical protein